MPRFVNEGRPVYFSYAHKNDENPTVDSIVNELEKEFIKADIEHILDRHNLPIGLSIQKFEEEIGRAEFIVIVLSDKYLKSEHCMYEYKCIQEDKRINESKIPLYIKNNDIDLKSDRYIKGLLDFWQSKKASAPYTSEFGLNAIQELCVKNDFYKFEIENIRRTISDINHTNTDSLRADNFFKFITDLKKLFDNNSDESFFHILRKEYTHIKIDIKNTKVKDKTKIVNGKFYPITWVYVEVNQNGNARKFAYKLDDVEHKVSYSDIITSGNFCTQVNINIDTQNNNQKEESKENTDDNTDRETNDNTVRKARKSIGRIIYDFTNFKLLFGLIIFFVAGILASMYGLNSITNVKYIALGASLLLMIIYGGVSLDGLKWWQFILMLLAWGLGFWIGL